MNHKLLLGLPLAMAMTVSAHASITDHFDSYTLGSELHGQSGWTGWDSNPEAGALVSNAYAYSGTQSVSITGASDLVHTFSGISEGQWIFSIMQYIPTTTAAGISYLILMNQYNDGETAAKSWSSQIECDMALGEVRSDTKKLTMVKDAWVELRCEIDLTTNTVKEYYNGELLRTRDWQDGNGLDELQAVDLYANNVGPVYYDNLNVGPVISDPFASWIGPFFPGITDPAVIGETADPDHDGISNLMEYVLQDGNPAVSSTAILPTASTTDTALRFIFHRRAATIPGTTQTFQYGSNLRDWTDVPITNGGMVTITANTPSLGIDEVIVTVPQAANTKLFGRLNAIKP